MLERYFDHAATTPVDPRVAEAMAPYLSEHFGNAHSLHSPGRRAAHAVESAREAVAALIGEHDPSHLVFTSGATEANNWIAQRVEGIACSPFEHASMLEAVLASSGEILKNDGYRIAHTSGAISVIHVNNETGAILRVPSGPDPQLVHRDFTQTIGKLPVPEGLYDLASFSSHKLYGPKGVGVLWSRGERWPHDPLLYGGEHERGLRAGTLNVPAIVGFGEACRIAADRIEEDETHAEELRAIVLSGLANLSDWRENSHVSQSPYILSLSFHGIEAQTVLEAVDVRGYAISGGAACSSRSQEPSHVLTALGIEPDWLRGTIRVSFGRSNTIDSAHGLASALVEGVETARKLQKSR